ncbi:MAG: DUF1836 domain-containing protein [Oscillospiraceae bacterium]|nr:DUF1836 domain-containing protein [Oscillospiraceae bacterium]
MKAIEVLRAYRCPGYQDYPAISLYKDQVVTFLNEAVAPFYPGESSPVTAAMINNYVKLKVISPPVRKKYDREQVVSLYVLFLLKQVLSMEEIRKLLQREFARQELEVSYKYFKHGLERALSSLPSPALMTETQGERPLLEAAIGSFVCRQCVSLLLREER